MILYVNCFKRLFLVLLMFCAIEMLSARTITGRVYSEGKGVKNVVVTDGVHFAQTNNEGVYNLLLGDNVSFVYISSPSGYLPKRRNSIPLFYQPIESHRADKYDFELDRNTRDDSKQLLLVHADAQLFKEGNLEPYNQLLDDCIDLINANPDSETFGIDCGDIVGDKPQLYPSYIASVDRLKIPFYRVMGNHDMNLYGRSHETSYKTFESLFGPSYYSFNRGKVHYVVLNDVFYLARDYFYAGYLNEKQLAWLEKDLSFVGKNSLVFVALHIPTRLELAQLPFEYSNENIAGRVSNAASLYKMLEPFRAHILAGHTHYNRNLEYSSRLYEHITAAVCGTWWQGAVCLDGTPKGYGVYEINGDSVKWYFKSAGFPKDYQMRVYKIGSSSEYPDDVIVNVWNWDEKWTVEWFEDGILMGNMLRVSLCDPAAKALCDDKEKLEFKWISPFKNDHMFRAPIKNKNARIEICVTDRFGNKYRTDLKRINHD